jgi:hypothetical protein
MLKRVHKAGIDYNTMPSPEKCNLNLLISLDRERNFIRILEVTFPEKKFPNLVGYGLSRNR